MPIKPRLNPIIEELFRKQVESRLKPVPVKQSQHYDVASYAHVLKALVKYCHEGEHLLEVGFRNPEFLHFLRRHGLNVLGVDPNPQGITTEYKDISLHRSNFLDTNFVANSQDIIVFKSFFDAPEVMFDKTKEISDYADKCHQILRDGGRVIVEGPLDNSEIKEFAMCGFDLVELNDLYNAARLCVFRKR